MNKQTNKKLVPFNVSKTDYSISTFNHDMNIQSTNKNIIVYSDSFEEFVIEINLNCSLPHRQGLHLLLF